MLSNKTELYEDEFTPEEYECMREHQRTSKDDNIDWTHIFEAWRDLNKNLCVMYENGITYRYKPDGKHRIVKYVLVGDYSDGSRHHESNFTSEDDLMESVNAYLRIAEDRMVCLFNNSTLDSFRWYIDGEIAGEY